MTVAVKTLLFHDAGPAARRARQRAVNEVSPVTCDVQLGAGG
jgi:hypothetical protein